MIQLWNPLFEQCKNYLPKCAFAYIQIMQKLLCEVDKAFECKDKNTLRVLYITYGYFFEALLPFVQDEKVHEAFRQILEGDKQQQAQFSKGCWDFNSMNAFFVKASNALNDSFKECECDNSNP